MLHTKKYKLLICVMIIGVLIFGAFAFRSPQPSKPHPESKLKVLPKNISHDDLMAVMHSFEKALNYKCGDCHARSVTNPKKLDFGSYANPKKQTALEMMKMIRKINKKHFGIKGKFAENYLQAKYRVTCYTCHHGSEHPETGTPFH